MQKKWKNIIGSICFCGVLSSVPFTAYADTAAIQITMRSDGTGYIESINQGNISQANMNQTNISQANMSQTNISQGNSSENPIMVAKRADDAEEALDEEETIMLANAQAEEFASATVQMQAAVQEEIAKAQAAQVKTELRQQVVNYALSFLGGPYRYGGNDPRTGVDCSGFTRFIMSNAAGVQLARSSGSQAGQGVAISAEQMQPGDLIFYSKGGSINHVAMYIGSGKVVHASTYATGIKISDWNYRTPAKIINVLG